MIKLDYYDKDFLLELIEENHKVICGVSISECLFKCQHKKILEKLGIEVPTKKEEGK